jgi:hypothetical protein
MQKIYVQNYLILNEFLNEMKSVKFKKIHALNSRKPDVLDIPMVHLRLNQTSWYWTIQKLKVLIQVWFSNGDH